MQTLKFIPSLIILLLISCSEKTQTVSVQNNLNSGIENFEPHEKNLQKNNSRYANEENINKLIEENKASFLIFGIASDDYSAFEKKYGVKVKTENCVIMPNVSKLVIENNETISKYLSRKYQDDWKSDLKILPFGLN